MQEVIHEKEAFKHQAGFDTVTYEYKIGEGKSMVEHQPVATKPNLLYETYFLPEVTGREMQIREISPCLEPALQKLKPLHIWLYGESGTGKTLIARYILRKLQKEAEL